MSTLCVPGMASLTRDFGTQTPIRFAINDLNGHARSDPISSCTIVCSKQLSSEDEHDGDAVDDESQSSNEYCGYYTDEQTVFATLKVFLARDCPPELFAFVVRHATPDPEATTSDAAVGLIEKVRLVEDASEVEDKLACILPQPMTIVNRSWGNRVAGMCADCRSAFHYSRSPEPTPAEGIENP